MNVELTPQALEDIGWLAAQQPKLLKRCLRLIEDIRRAPSDGLGKPEPLKGSLPGWWSRRIDGEHRLVYRVTGTGEDARIQIVQCRYHY